MPGFRRAQLRGSDELFRSTNVTRVAEPEVLRPVPNGVSRVPATATQPEGTLVRLTHEEIQLLSDALQRLKYPQKLGPKPPVDEYERLEELRQKLLHS